jgi:hypothetical protein
MAGTGYRPEGHDWRPYAGTLHGYRWICGTCAQLTDDITGDNSECIDDC